MTSDELRRAILEIAREPELRGELRRALGVVEIDPAALLERMDRNSEEIRELRQDFERGMADFRAEMAALRKEFQARMDVLQEEMSLFRKEQQGTSRSIAALRLRSDALGARWGIQSEQAFREGMATVVEGLVGNRTVRKWRYRDEEGVVFGHPAWVEIDVVIENGDAILVEVKSSASRADVASLARVAKLYESAAGRRPSKVLLVSPFVDGNAEELARTLGIEVSTSTDV